MEFLSRLVWKMAEATIASPFAGAVQEQDARSTANLRMAIASKGQHLLMRRNPERQGAIQPEEKRQGYHDYKIIYKIIKYSKKI